MKISIKQVVIGSSCTVLASCSVIFNSHSKYVVANNKVYLEYMNVGLSSGQTRYEVPGADAATFKDLGNLYGADRRNVFFRAKKVVSADPASFRLKRYYAVTNSSVYLDGKQIDGADPVTYHRLPGTIYARDAHDYYLDTVALHVTDLPSFTILGASYKGWAKDRTHYYVHSTKRPLSDYATFRYLGNNYALDKHQVYFRDSVVVGAEPATFAVFFNPSYSGYGYSKQWVYFGSHRLAIHPSASFRVVGLGYVKDSVHVYNAYKGGAIVEGADPATFENFAHLWARDKNHYYCRGRLMPDVDRATFQNLDYNYYKDKNNVYHYDKLIVGADAATFAHLPYTQDARDKTGCYRLGKRIDCSVLATP